MSAEVLDSDGRDPFDPNWRLPTPQQCPAKAPSRPVASLTQGASHTPGLTVAQRTPAPVKAVGQNMAVGAVNAENIPQPPAVLRPSSHAAAMAMIASGGGTAEELKQAQEAMEAKLAMGVTLTLYRTRADLVDIQAEIESLNAIARNLQLQLIQALNGGQLTRAKVLQEMQQAVSKQIVEIRDHREALLNPNVKGRR